MGDPVVNSQKDKLYHQPQKTWGEGEGAILLYQWFTHIKNAVLFVQPRYLIIISSIRCISK